MICAGMMITAERGQLTIRLSTPVEWHLMSRAIPSQRMSLTCRCKVRMSGLSKVEMSGFMGRRGTHGNGAYRFEPARPRSIKGAARSTEKAFDAGGGRQAAEGDGPSGAATAVCAREAWR